MALTISDKQEQTVSLEAKPGDEVPISDTQAVGKPAALPLPLRYSAGPLPSAIPAPLVKTSRWPAVKRQIERNWYTVAVVLLALASGAVCIYRLLWAISF